MLTLPKNWTDITGATLLIDLLRQVELNLHGEFGRLWIRTLLELAVRTWVNPRKNLSLTEVSEGRWHINRLHYVYFAHANDNALYQCETMDKRLEVIVIVPPDYEAVFRRALDTSMQGRRTSVTSISLFTSWRLSSAEIDTKSDRKQMTIRFLRAFNQNVDASCHVERFRVDIPSSS